MRKNQSEKVPSSHAAMISLSSHTNFIYFRLHHDDKQLALDLHERQLDELQEEAHEAASELDRKVSAMKNIIKEKEVYLSKAQDLLSSRYKEYTPTIHNN